MKQKLILSSVIGFIIALSVGTSVYYYRQYTEVKKLLADPTAASQQEVKSIIAKIGTFMVLPTDEDPCIATVLDVEKLKEQPFFAKAVNGDKVVIYTKAGKAILYRPSENKIIEVMPISLTQPEGDGANPSSAPLPTPKTTEKPTE